MFVFGKRNYKKFCESMAPGTGITVRYRRFLPIYKVEINRDKQTFR